MIFKIIALVILAAFYACYYGKMFIQRKKGIKTTQVGKGKTGFVKAVECTMMAASVAVFVTEVVSIVLGTSLLPDSVRWLGVGIATLGVGIFLMFFNWALFAVSVFGAVMFHLQIVNVEEDFLLETFGEEYLNYKNKVNRYLGRKIVRR